MRAVGGSERVKWSWTSLMILVIYVPYCHSDPLKTAFLLGLPKLHLGWMLSPNKKEAGCKYVNIGI